MTGFLLYFAAFLTTVWGVGHLFPTKSVVNPDLIDLWFVLPGIIGLILQTLAIEQAAVFIVRDRELGLMEQILSTPARQLELILSKMIPLLILCLIALGISLGLSIVWFGIPFQGNPWLYLWLSVMRAPGLMKSLMRRARRRALYSQRKWMADDAWRATGAMCWTWPDDGTFCPVGFISTRVTAEVAT